MVTSSVVRTALAEFFVEQADWRRQKAEQYPEDARNRNASDALTVLAGYVSGLPDDDEILVAFTAVPLVFDEGVFSEPHAEGSEYPSRSGSEASRYGFHGDNEPAADPRRWLAAWLTTVTNEAEDEAEALAERAALLKENAALRKEISETKRERFELEGELQDLTILRRFQEANEKI